MCALHLSRSLDLVILSSPRLPRNPPHPTCSVFVLGIPLKIISVKCSRNLPQALRPRHRVSEYQPFLRRPWPPRLLPRLLGPVACEVLIFYAIILRPICCRETTIAAPPPHRTTRNPAAQRPLRDPRCTSRGQLATRPPPQPPPQIHHLLRPAALRTRQNLPLHPICPPWCPP